MKAKEVFVATFLTLAILTSLYSESHADSVPEVLASSEQNESDIATTGSNLQNIEDEQGLVEYIGEQTKNWEQRFIEPDSWIHVVAVVRGDTDWGLILPDGSLLPQEFLQDDWYYVGSTGLVEKGIFTIKDVSGVVLQQSILNDGVATNLTFDFSLEDQRPYELSLDFGFLAQLTQTDSANIRITESEQIDGERVIQVFQYVEVQESPVRLGNEEKVVQSIRVEGYFDKAEGTFWKVQTFWILENEEELLFNLTELVSIEILKNSPSAALELLEGQK